jgi:hypothetical protein
MQYDLEMTGSSKLGTVFSRKLGPEEERQGWMGLGFRV